ncbi:MAG: DUF3015 domain-containing protein [Nitrospiraceae bacterium]|jgi:DUF3015 family protein|nr:DUF3015 domain-containing protein [Nitrospiraceae bacterium]
MKKVAAIQVAIGFACLQATAAMAANPDTGPGCGLGKLAWGEYTHQKNIAPQSMMATTNVVGSYTFGISFGTSGCTNDGKIMSEHKVMMFAGMNYDSLSQEMAQGSGEHLASLAALMGVPAEQQNEFFSLTQDKYTTLIQSGETTPVAMMKALEDVMAAHPVFAKLSMNR